MLKRAIRTLWLVLDEMDLMWIPVHRDWRLNERHYGALQGLNKAETAKKFGEAHLKLWRRGYDVRPPALETDDPRHPRHDARYKQLSKYLDGVSDADIVELNIPTGIPLVYELDEQLRSVGHHYLGDAERVAKATKAVAGQASLKA